jgi:predicted metal-dependent hydrolase
MIGVFGKEFWREYEKLVPKTEPAHEWEDRMLLYEL